MTATTRTRCAAWPTVLPNDDGIRPAGPPDACFYCKQQVLRPHAVECVTVTKLVRYRVLVADRVVGTYELYEPHSWDRRTCEAVRNGGHWCAANAVPTIEWRDASCAAHATESIGAGCGCSVLRFEVVEVLDPGPFVEVRGDHKLN